MGIGPGNIYGDKPPPPAKAAEHLASDRCSDLVRRVSIDREYNVPKIL